MEKHLWTIKELLLLPKFDNNSSPVTRDKKICQSHMIMRWWHQCLLRRSAQWNHLNEFYLLSKFDVSSFSMTGDVYIYIFKLVILQTLSSSKLIFILLTLGKWKLTLLVHSYWYWAGHSYFTEFGQDIRPQKTIETLSDKNFKNHAEDLTPVIFNNYISGNLYNWVHQLTNTLQ